MCIAPLPFRVQFLQAPAKTRLTYQPFLTKTISAAQQRGIRKMAELPDFGQSQMSRAHSQQPLISARAKTSHVLAAGSP